MTPQPIRLKPLELPRCEDGSPRQLQPITIQRAYDDKVCLLSSPNTVWTPQPESPPGDQISFTGSSSGNPIILKPQSTAPMSGSPFKIIPQKATPYKPPSSSSIAFESGSKPVRQDLQGGLSLSDMTYSSYGKSKRMTISSFDERRAWMTDLGISGEL